MGDPVRRSAGTDDVADFHTEIRPGGVAVLERLIKSHGVDGLAARLTDELEGQDFGGADFFGKAENPATTLFARGFEFNEALLLNYRVDSSVAMQVRKRDTNQPLHGREWCYRPCMTRDRYGREPTAALLIASVDITKDDGATPFMPGSNKRPEERSPSASGVVQAPMLARECVPRVQRVPGRRAQNRPDLLARGRSPHPGGKPVHHRLLEGGDSLAKARKTAPPRQSLWKESELQRTAERSRSYVETSQKRQGQASQSGRFENAAANALETSQ